MSNKVKLTLITLLLLVSFLLSYGIGYIVGTEAVLEPKGFESVEQVWDIILSEYVANTDVDVDLLAEGAIKGMIDALNDPYTAYLDAEAYHLELGDIEGKFEGIGAEVAIRDGQLTVIAPMADSPAAKAGIRAADVILEADGKLTSEMSLVEAVFNIRGPKGTSVRLLILHQDEAEPVEIEVIRGEIALTSVHFEMLDDIAYIRISQFAERTDEDLEAVLVTMAEEAAAGIILDLRHNPGGLLDTVINVTSHFLEEGVVLVIRDNKGNEEVIEVNPQEVTTELRVVVLVDSASASGSEVVAGALQDHDRAIISGSTTFGKGSVNVLMELGDGAGLFITTSRWLTPDGHLIEGQGITPDYELTEEDAIMWAIDYLHGNK
jgi:carboxyl-terminal processing protease|tara:strand:- start:1464 stop:2597 length:1134 start_codon:yes stop_codon:yes gene_type:complete